MGPGAYSPERADLVTKTKTTTAVNMGSSPPRGSFIRQGDSNVGPGQYDDRNYDFGNKAKGFTIGEKRETRTVETMGPGSYNVEQADGVINSKTTTTVNMGASSPARGSFQRQGDSNVGPGQYDDRNYDFGNKAKGFTIGEKRETRTVESMGPGAYSPERADTITKTKTTTTINMASSPARPASFAKKEDANIAPGQYDDRNYEFGSNTKSFTIGEKR